MCAVEPGEHPAEITVAAAGIEHPAAGEITEHAQQHRVDQMPLAEVTVVGHPGKHVLRHE